MTSSHQLLSLFLKPWREFLPWNAKVGSQEIPGVTDKFGLGVQNEAGQRLIEFCQENSLVRANTLFQQYKKRLYAWTLPDHQYRNLIDYILCSQRWRSLIQSAKTRPGADCGSEHELLIAKFRLTCYSLENFQTWFSVSLSQSEYKPLKGKQCVSVVVCIPGDARLAKQVNSLYCSVSVDGQYINMNFYVMILWPIFCPFLFL